MLYDLRGMTGEPTMADLRQFMSEAAQITRPRGLLAIVATDPVIYARACTYATLGRATLNVKVFRNVDEGPPKHGVKARVREADHRNRVHYGQRLERSQRRVMATTAKKKTAKKKTAGKPNAAFMKPMTPSTALAEVIGAKPIPRTEVTQKLWVYIKKNGLQDAKNRRMINADPALKTVFGGKASVSMFEMTKLVGKHLK